MFLSPPDRGRSFCGTSYKHVNIRPLYCLLFALIAVCRPSCLFAQEPSSPSSAKSISLDLEDADIQSAMRIIAEVSGFNIVLHPNVVGKVTLRLRNVPWEQAFELLLRDKGLYKVREGNVIIVYPLRLYIDDARKRAG